MAKTYTYNTYGSNLSHLYTVDGGVFSANRVATSAFDYFADDAAVDDAIYFLSSEWFRNVKLYVGTAFAATSVTFVWEYWNGSAWVALSNVVDNTSDFSVLGENTVTWDLPAQGNSWRDTTVNGITFRMAIRCRISAISNPTEGGAQSTQNVQAGNNTITATGGTSGDRLTLDNIYTADLAGGWGALTRVVGSYEIRSSNFVTCIAYESRARIIIGDNSTQDYFQLPLQYYLFMGGVGNYFLLQKTDAVLGGSMNSAISFPCGISGGSFGADRSSLTPTNSTCLIQANNFSWVFGGRRNGNGNITLQGASGSYYTDSSIALRSSTDGAVVLSTSHTFTRVHLAGGDFSFPSGGNTLTNINTDVSSLTGTATLTIRNLTKIAGTGNWKNFGYQTNQSLVNVSGFTSFQFNSNGERSTYLKWEFNLIVTDRNGNAIEGATVKIVNALGVTVATLTTDSNGAIAQQDLIEEDFHVISGSATISKGNGVANTPHTVTITKTGYQTKVIEYNMTKKRDEVEVLENRREA